MRGEFDIILACVFGSFIIKPSFRSKSCKPYSTTIAYINLINSYSIRAQRHPSFRNSIRRHVGLIGTLRNKSKSFFTVTSTLIGKSKNVNHLNSTRPVASCSRRKLPLLQGIPSPANARGLNLPAKKTREAVCAQGTMSALPGDSSINLTQHIQVMRFILSEQ